jgi:hypothetical protein
VDGTTGGFSRASPGRILRAMASLQIRSKITDTFQQHANRAMGSALARQVKTVTTSASVDDFPLKDCFLCDTSSGSITMTLLRGSDDIIGIPIFFYKTSASNTLTVQRLAGSGNTIEGSTSVATTGNNTIIALFWDGLTYRRWNASVAAGTGLLAANDLSDLNSIVTARTNLGVNKEYIPLRVTTLVGSNVYRVICKYAGTVTRVDSITEGVLTTGDATLQSKLNGSNIGSTTTGLITITQSGSAAGDKDSASPLTTNITVAVGDELSLTVGGTNATATVANCWFEVTRT